MIALHLLRQTLCDATISAVDFEGQDIFKIIGALDINKAHGHDNISTCVINICDSNIVKSLSIISRKQNIAPVHKKETSN